MASGEKELQDIIDRMRAMSSSIDEQLEAIGSMSDGGDNGSDPLSGAEHLPRGKGRAGDRAVDGGGGDDEQGEEPEVS